MKPNPAPDPTRFSFNIEATLVGKTEKEAVEWVQKCFDFFHRTLEAKVTLNGRPVVVAPKDPVEKILDQISDAHPATSLLD